MVHKLHNFYFKEDHHKDTEAFKKQWSAIMPMVYMYMVYTTK